MEQFVCNATITVKYKYKQIKPFLKCMNISQKTLIRTNEEGLLCCQFMVQVESHTCYLEYFVSIYLIDRVQKVGFFFNGKICVLIFTLSFYSFV